MMNNPKKAVIVCALDSFANSNMPLALVKRLTALGFSTDVINTMNFPDAIKSLHKKPFLGLTILVKIEKLTQKISDALFTRFPFLTKYLRFFFIWTIMRLREQIIFALVKLKHYDLLICENALDSRILLQKAAQKTYYNCPTPFADELFYGNQLTNWQYKLLLDEEKAIYKATTYLSFHWATYTDYVKKYIYDGANLLYANSGCSIKTKTAEFACPLRIVYLGYLGGYWIDLGLLSRLTKLYPHIDVYGEPKPPEQLKLNYKGYAKPDVLSEYQLGLITITKDRLRCEGTSAKHVEYLSYGLPVLVPEWRTSVKEMGGTIFYNEKNFLEVISQLQKKPNWLTASKEALKESKKYEWGKVFSVIDKIAAEA